MAIYMKYDGGAVAGDVTAAGFEGQIELNSFQWGVGRGISSPVGASADREASAPSISEIVVTKAQDKATEKLLKEAYQGEGVDAIITFTKTDKGNLEPYLVYTLGDVMISGYSLSSGGDRPSESISLNFTKIETKVIPNKDKGETGDPLTVTFDLAAAKVV